MQSEIVKQAQDIKDTVDQIDALIDDASNRNLGHLLETYKSINIILRAQLSLLQDKPNLRVIEE